MPAHPRSRGENEAHCLVPSGVYGSSPLTRGKRLDHEPLIPTARLIPAHAGKTIQVRLCLLSAGAHPRSRGENVECQVKTGLGKGSSPLTRGKLRVGVILSAIGGLIPAHAGKTSSARRPSRPTEAHPRSRGENWTQSSGNETGKGSSPLTRGKPSCSRSSRKLGRLIPAHAGKTHALP